MKRIKLTLQSTTNSTIKKMSTARIRPNILITGTPGTGKSTICENLVTVSDGMTHVDLGKLVKEKGLHSGFDSEFDAFTLDEDMVCDELEDRMCSGGVILEAHSCDYFPERWFDLVVVLRCSNTVLFDRLNSRGYSKRKLDENVEAEIMQVVLDEARESYSSEIIWEFVNESIDHLQFNTSAISSWIHDWPSSFRRQQPR